MLFSGAAVASFFAKPLVKYLGGALVVGILVWVAVSKFNNWKDSIREEGRQTGIAQTTEVFQRRVAENDRVNRAVEQRVETQLGEFAEEIEEAREERQGRESTSERLIERTIVEQPQVFNNRNCDVPQDVIDARNAIREEGPAPRRRP